MKQLTVVLVVLIVLAAGTPVVVGTMTESRLTEQARIISDNDLLAVTVRDYERGWLTSSAKLDVGLSERYRERVAEILIERQDESVPDPAIEAMLGRTVTFTVDLSHGPIMTDGGPRTGLSSSVIRLDPQTEGLEKLLLKLGVPYLFEIRTHSDFTGASSFEMDVPPMAFEDPNGALDFSGLTAEGTFDVLDRHVVGNGRMDSLQLTSELATLTAENLTLSNDNRMISTYLWEGPVEIVLERLTILNATPDGPPRIEASNLGFSASTSLDDTGERLDMNASYHIDSVTGEELSLTDARFEMAMHNLDVAALEDYHRITQDLMLEPGDMPLALPALQDTFYQLLVAEPGIDLGPVNFVWNGEPFEAVVRISTDTEMLPPQVAFSLMDPTLWTRLFSVEAEIDVAQSMAERLAAEALEYQLGSADETLDDETLEAMAAAQGPGMLLLLAAQGMIEVSETGYRSRLTFTRGILDVNGREIPLGPQF